MSINTSEFTTKTLRAVTDVEFQATLRRIGSHTLGLGKELAKAIAQWRNLR